MRDGAWPRTVGIGLVLAALVGAGCAAEGDERAPPGEGGQGPAAAPVSPEQMPGALVEPGGMHWRKTRVIVPAPANDEEADAPPATGPPQEPSVGDLTVDQVARRLRPLMLFNGVEYEASWEDALRIAASAQAATRAAAGRPPAAISETRQPVVVSPVDTRIDISAQATVNPYLNVAALKRMGRLKADPTRSVIVRCTCFKVDKFTCVTAAHCVANNWVKQHAMTWKTPSTIRFGAAAPLGGLAEIDPLVTPYSIVIPSGYWASGVDEAAIARYDFAVIRFRGQLLKPSLPGALAPISRPASPATAPVPPASYETGSPGYLRMAEFFVGGGRTVAVVGYPEDGWPALMYADGNLRLPDGSGMLLYDTDTNGGESGAPVLWTDDQQVLRVVGVHRGPGPFGWNMGVQFTLEVIDWIAAVHGY
jgi:V8-like Glu-specific endopeptidase